MADQLACLQSTYNAGALGVTINTLGKKAGTLVAAPFTSFRAPPLQKPMAAEAVKVKPAETTTTEAKVKRWDFKLGMDMEGNLLTEIQVLYEKRKKPVAVAAKITISKNIARVINHFYKGPSEGNPKQLKCIR